MTRVEIELGPMYVTVTAADWNGETFDGCPFALAEDEIPEWLTRAIEGGRIAINRVGHYDYAKWLVVVGEEMNEIAGPGDQIHYCWMTGALRVVREGEEGYLR